MERVFFLHPILSSRDRLITFHRCIEIFLSNAFSCCYPKDINFLRVNENNCKQLSLDKCHKRIHTYCNKKDFYPREFFLLSKKVKNLAKTMDRRTKESKEIFGRAISRFTEKALEERNDFLCLRHP